MIETAAVALINDHAVPEVFMLKPTGVDIRTQRRIGFGNFDDILSYILPDQIGRLAFHDNPPVVHDQQAVA